MSRLEVTLLLITHIMSTILLAFSSVRAPVPLIPASKKMGPGSGRRSGALGRNYNQLGETRTNVRCGRRCYGTHHRGLRCCCDRRRRRAIRRRSTVHEQWVVHFEPPQTDRTRRPRCALVLRTVASRRAAHWACFALSHCCGCPARNPDPAATAPELDSIALRRRSPGGFRRRSIAATVSHSGCRGRRECCGRAPACCAPE